MKRFAILATAIVLVVVAWSGAWLYAAGEIRRTIDAQAAADGISSPRLTCGTLEVAGFPFRFDVTCLEASAQIEDMTVDLAEWRATVLVYRPTHLLAFGRGPARITDAFTGSSSELSWEELEASVRLSGWRIARASLTADTIAWSDTLVGQSLIGSASHLEAHLIDMPDAHEPERGVSALAAYVRLEDVSAPGFDVAGGEATLEAELTGIPDDVRAFGDPDLLPRWQQAGGALNLVGFRAQAGEQFFQSTGSLQLSDAGLANGRFDVESRGILEEIGDMLPPDMRQLILGNPDADGTYSQSIGLTNGVIFSGMLPIGMIPALF
ncbi:DUF2125 domain-containing protein [Arsenicitalea aurantiaca]|uniref:DUF2125 domain-containing protein n=1 Tax=Arsenicitalea aurantiaca TaxID=1783274 RepID=A0A433X5V8_9HYPH|nr:DUF2125 domain-containing protein [Arsenicitalea aurantiaca]RUT29442.1 DUF2125 domain-containing protein [Arsenicitalea aurantiaca]